MKFFNFRKLTQFTLLIFLAFQSFADINDANWYLSVDLDQIENNEINKVIEEKIGNSTNGFQKIPQEISYISLYGNAQGADNATAIIKGNFDQFSVKDYVLEFLYQQDEVSHLIKESTIQFKNREIQVMNIGEYEGQSDDSPKAVYFTQVNNELSVISFQLGEVKKWLGHEYDNHQITKGNLFSVVVDVQSALAHMGMNIDKDHHTFQSEIFQKINQVSASVSEEDTDMLVEVALSATDGATAKQIEQIINGLAAMSNLSGASNQSDIQTNFLQNLTIETNGNTIFISSFALLDDLKKLALQQDINSDNDEVKIEVNVEL